MVVFCGMVFKYPGKACRVYCILRSGHLGSWMEQGMIKCIMKSLQIYVNECNGTHHMNQILFEGILPKNAEKPHPPVHPSCQAPWDHGGQGTENGWFVGKFRASWVAPVWLVELDLFCDCPFTTTPTFAERGLFLGIGVDWTTVTFYHGMKSDLVNIWRTFGQPSWPSKFKISNINMTKKIFVSTVNYCSR